MFDNLTDSGKRELKESFIMMCITFVIGCICAFGFYKLHLSNIDECGRMIIQIFLGLISGVDAVVNVFNLCYFMCLIIG